MSLLDIVQRANRKMFASKMRSILTILAITVGSTTLTLAVGAGAGVQEVFNRQVASELISNVVTVFPGFTPADGPAESDGTGIPNYDELQEESGLDPLLAARKITKEQLDEIANLEFVGEIFPYYTFIPEYLTIEGSDLKMVPPRLESVIPNQTLHLIAGESLDLNQDQVVVADEFSKKLGVTPQELLGRSLALTFLNANEAKFTQMLQIVGVTSTSVTSSPGVFIPYNVAVNLHDEIYNGTKEHRIATNVTVALTEEVTSDQLNSLMSNLNSMGFYAYSEQQIQEGIGQVTSYLTVGMVGFASIVIFASVFGIINTMLMSVYERTKEIGLMKAVGTSNAGIFKLFAFEGALIGFWGGLVGILTGLILGQIFNKVLANFFENQGVEDELVLIFPFLWLATILVSMSIIGFLASVFPAAKASRLDPIQALRYE